MKKVLALVLSIIMLFGMISVVAVAGVAEDVTVYVVVPNQHKAIDFTLEAGSDVAELKEAVALYLNETVGKGEELYNVATLVLFDNGEKVANEVLLDDIAGDTLEIADISFTVTFVNDGEIIEVDEKLPEGAAVSFDGEEPEKEMDAAGVYTFIGWNTDKKATEALDLSQEVVTGDVTYYAVYSRIAHVYDKWHVTREDTLDQSGLEERVCVVCGFVQTNEFELNHICSRCGKNHFNGSHVNYIEQLICFLKWFFSKNFTSVSFG